MGKETGIPWCDKTFNPWHGCVEVSPECDNCYAREFDARFGDSHWGDVPRRFFGEKHWNEPLHWNKAAEAGARGKDGRRTLVFCASMCDVFEKLDGLEPWRFKLWGLIKATPHLTWLLLTKRPQFISKMLPEELWGSPNIWIGTTVGYRQSLWRAEELINQRMITKLPVGFLSVEPLLEPLSISTVINPKHMVDWGDGFPRPHTMCAWSANWVIVGSESGDKARPMETAWAASVIRECEEARVPVFMKQADEDAPEISALPPPGQAPSVTHPPYRRRDLRLKPDGMRRTHWIVERPFIHGKQYVQWPA